MDLLDAGEDRTGMIVHIESQTGMLRPLLACSSSARKATEKFSRYSRGTGR